MKPDYLQTTEEVLSTQGSSSRGLTGEEAAARLSKHGPNRLQEAKKITNFQRFVQQLKDPMLLILLAAAAVSAVTSILSHESLTEVFIILVVVLLNAVLGVVQESKAEAAIEALQTMTAATSKVLRDGKITVLHSVDLVPGDVVILEAGDAVPADGRLLESASLKIEEAALTGESVPVAKKAGVTVYAGTVVEEGEITLCVKEANGSSKYEKIMTMIEESEKLKSSLESKAEHLADRLVPYTFLGTGLVWLFTGNVTKTISVLMVDFSCALKLAMPLTVLSAIREGSCHDMTVKGGKYLEAMSEATTIVFDKTGTLTKAQPTVVDVVSFDGQEPDELLKIAACLEEHFPHSMAKAVVRAAADKHLEHEEMHSKVEYIVAHGISSHIGEKKVIIGSYHFVFEDEGAKIPEGKEALFEALPAEYSHLYMAIDNSLAAVISIEDPLSKEASEVIRSL